MKKTIIITVMISVLLLLSGCEWLKITGQSVKDLPVKEQQKIIEEVIDTIEASNQSKGKASSPAMGAQEEPLRGENEKEPYCGDGSCDAGERCDKCSDCACAEGVLCYEGSCQKVECMTDNDCVDEDGCTVDKCMFAGHPNAFCSTEVITERRNNDGCCPPRAYVDVDSDCIPVCGDGRCDYGENERSCLEDCEHYGEGGSSGSSAPSSPTYAE